VGTRSNSAVRLSLWVVLMFGAAVPCFAQQSATDQLIQFYQRRAAQDPDNYSSFDRLASAYMQKARETGDPTYYELSEKAFTQALVLLPADKPESAATSAHLAALYLAEHRFTDSLALIKKSIVLDPALLSAYATLGDVELETGDYDEAAVSYAQLNLPENSLPPRPGIAYLSETRQANLCFIRGKQREAIAHMQAAIAKAIDSNLPKENVAWSQFSLGELYFGTGNLAKAEESYQASLSAYPNYHRANAWLGQLRISQGRYAEAAELYRKAIAVIPLPAYVAALGDIETKLGHTMEAQKQYGVVDFIAKLSALNQQLFRRELATFYADHDVHLGEALEFAQLEIKQRQDVYTWDVLAWVAYKHGKISEASAAIAHALAQGTIDPLLFFHAGMIYERAGDYAKAKEFLEKAVAINPRFHIFSADQANQVLARLKRQSSERPDAPNHQVTRVAR
jgi:tetratricopeptide (TPR) repeat protein